MCLGSSRNGTGSGISNSSQVALREDDEEDPVIGQRILNNNGTTFDPRDHILVSNTQQELAAIHRRRIPGMMNGRHKSSLKGARSQRRDVRILLLGDRNVGKTSLILSLISEEFLEDVPPRADEITIPPDVTPQFVPTHIVDFSFEEQTEAELFEEVSRAHVVCLLFSLNELQSIMSLTDYWLPLLSSSSTSAVTGGSASSSSSASRQQQHLTTASGDTSSNQQQLHHNNNHNNINNLNPNSHMPQIILVGNKSDLASPEPIIETHIEPIMNQFPNIETFVACSARELSNVSEVFHYAQKAVLHPSSPLFNYEISELTMPAVRALHRIFRLCDLDNDGLLNDNEINFLQIRAFGAPLDRINLMEIKNLIQSNKPDGIVNDCITEPGFLFLNNLFIQRGRIETTWTILRSFGYNDSLDIRQDLLEPQFDLKPGSSVELTSLGIDFLRSLFVKHDRDKDGALSPEELIDLFDLCPRPNPWGMDVVHSVTTNPKGWIDLNGFLCQWSMTSYLDTPRFMEYLAYFGYMEYDATNNSTAIRITRPKMEDVKSRVCTRSVFLCHVIGPEGAGKSSFLQGLLNRTVRHVRNLDHVNELSRYAINMLNYKGHQKYLLMHDFDVLAEDYLTEEDVDCDVIVLMYDASDRTSFRTVAMLYTNHFLNPDGAGGKFLPPVLICGAKSDRVEVKQDFEMSPALFCQRHQLPPPVLVSSWADIKPDVYHQLLQMAINPHKRRNYSDLYHSLVNSVWTQAVLATGAIALTSFLVYKLVK